MKASKNFASLVFLLAAVAVVGAGLASSVGDVMAEGAANVVKAVAGPSGERRCEWRDVEADEGYGVSRIEKRLICE
jgi:hypothetical protein